MAERKFQPGLWSTVITFAMFTTLIGLGCWQIQRLEWKTRLLSDIHSRMAEKPVPMPEKLDDPARWQYRRVTLAGSFDFTHEFLVKPRTYEGQNGYDMVVPFTRASGGSVLVNRGWISDALMEKAARPQDSLLQIEGVVQVPEKSAFTPANNPAKMDWYWIDIRAMADAAGVRSVAPVVVNISEKREGVYPVGGRVRADIPNDHRGYAIFWFGMAFILLIVYFLSSWQRPPKMESTYASL